MNIITNYSKKNFAFYKNLCITNKINLPKIKSNCNNNNNNNNNINNNNKLEDFIKLDNNTDNNKQPKDFNRLINTNSLLYKVDQNVSELQYLEQLYEIIEIKELK